MRGTTDSVAPSNLPFDILVSRLVLDTATQDRLHRSVAEHTARLSPDERDALARLVYA